MRAVVLHGEGRAFCAGLDVKSVVSTPGANEKLLHRPEGQIANLVQDAAFVWRSVQAPVIAALHGAVFGAGLQIALGADFRFASPCAQLSIMEIKWGLVPDLGATVTLRELVPIDVAKELTMTGRVVDAHEAKALNLVTRVCDEPLEESLRFAREVAGKSPDAIAAAKALYNRTWSASEEEALLVETEIQRRLLMSWNQVAASARGLKLPKLMQPGYVDPKEWSEADVVDLAYKARAIAGAAAPPPDGQVEAEPRAEHDGAKSQSGPASPT